MTKALLLPVVAAVLVDASGRMLLQQRPPGKQHAGLWEFPGGKIEAGETPEAALARELGEELGVAVDAAALEPVAFASRAHGDRRLVLLLYRRRDWAGTPRAIEGGAIAWYRLDQLAGLAMPPADRDLVAALTPRDAA